MSPDRDVITRGRQSLLAGRLWIGPAPDETFADFVYERNIQTLVTLADRFECDPDYYRPIRDDWHGADLAWLIEKVNLVAESLVEPIGNIYVHCAQASAVPDWSPQP